MKRSSIGLMVAVAALAAGAGWAQDKAATPPADKDEASSVVSEIVVRPVEEVPVPKVGVGAPQLTVEQIQKAQTAARRLASDDGNAVRKCSPRGPITGARPTSIKEMLGQIFQEEREAAQKVQRLADEARAATAAAQQVRRDAVTGKKTAEEVAASELARQKVVNAFVQAQDDLEAVSAAIPVMQMLIGQISPPGPNEGGGWELIAVNQILPQVDLYKLSWSADQKMNLAAKMYPGMVLERIQVRPGEDGQGRFLNVTGSIRNARNQALRMPPVKITELDSYGFPLSTVTADPGPGARLAAGEAKPFAYNVRPTTPRAQSVQVAFAAPRPPPRRSATAPIAPSAGDGPSADCSNTSMPPPPPMSGRAAMMARTMRR